MFFDYKIWEMNKKNEWIKRNSVSLQNYISFHVIWRPQMLSQKCFLSKWSLFNTHQRNEKRDKNSERRGGGGISQSGKKSQDCCVTFKPKILLSAHAWTLQPNIFFWIRKPWSVRLINGFVVGFRSWKPGSEQKIARLASKRVSRQNFLRRMG